MKGAVSFLIGENFPFSSFFLLFIGLTIVYSYYETVGLQAGTVRLWKRHIRDGRRRMSV